MKYIILLSMVTSGKNTIAKPKTALQTLNDLAKLKKLEKYKDIPSHCLSFDKYTDKKTNELTKSVIAWLRLNGYHCERTGSEGRIIDQRQTVTNVIGQTKTIGSLKRIYSSQTRGTSDLKAIINGKFIAIEIKNQNTKDRQSEAQRQYQKQIEASGGIYIIAASFQGFYDWFNEFIKKGL